MKVGLPIRDPFGFRSGVIEAGATKDASTAPSPWASLNSAAALKAALGANPKLAASKVKDGSLLLHWACGGRPVVIGDEVRLRAGLEEKKGLASRRSTARPKSSP